MNDIGIIIVTYNPKLDNFQGNFSKIIKLGCPTLIVDNGSEIKIKDKIISLNNSKPNSSCILLKENKGIGFAQNIGIDFFKNKPVNFLLFLDQDSYISLNNLKKLKTTLKSLKKVNTKAVMLGPAQDYDHLMSDTEETKLLISSGSLVFKTAFDKIGDFKAEFFIDYIDYEWVWRAQKKGYKVYKTKKVTMQHQTNGVLRVHGHTIDPIFRLYYIYRNSVYLILYERISKKQKLNLFIRNLGKLFFQINLPEKRNRYKACFHGIYDGVRKKLNV